MNYNNTKKLLSFIYRFFLPDHLGRVGLNNYCNMDKNLLVFLIKKLNLKSILDVGCANGAMVEVMKDLGLKAYGIDGDFMAIKFLSNKNIRKSLNIHDYKNGNSRLTFSVDLIWSIEFLEHVEKKYLHYILQDFQKFTSYVVISTPPPNSPGYHHVNCQNSDYWIKRFQAHGFKFLNDLTNQARIASKMSDRGICVDYFKKNGLIFKNINDTG